MKKTVDCILCGSCTVDILLCPVPLETPIGVGSLVRVQPIKATTGGLVSNAGIAMARLGMAVSAFTMLGDDDWAWIVKRTLQAEGIITRDLVTHSTAPTSVSAVTVDSDGERSFIHSQGAPKLIDRGFLLDHLDVFAGSRMLLLGYYPLMPNLQDDLPEVLPRIRETGCRIAMDTAGDGGRWQPLDRILPHLDVYVPSHREASHQTGCQDPRAIIQCLRSGGAPGLLGVKLGSRGALLSPAAGHFISIPAIPPPGPRVDTTGAGDVFYAGLLTGLLRGLDAEQAGRLAAAAAACCITGLGASAGLRDYTCTASLAGLTPAAVRHEADTG
jgi:ribokinase